MTVITIKTKNNFSAKIDPLGQSYSLAICRIFVHRNVMMFWHSEHYIPNLNVIVCAEVETPKFPFKEGFISKRVLDKKTQIRGLPRKWRSSSLWELKETVSKDYDGWQPHPPSEQRSAGDSGLEVGKTRSSGTSVSLARSETLELEPLLGVQGNLVFWFTALFTAS